MASPVKAPCALILRNCSTGIPIASDSNCQAGMPSSFNAFMSSALIRPSDDIFVSASVQSLICSAVRPKADPASTIIFILPMASSAEAPTLIHFRAIGISCVLS